MKLPRLTKQADFEIILQRSGLAFQGSKQTGMVTITNSAGFGLSEESVLYKYVQGIDLLVAQERHFLMQLGLGLGLGLLVAQERHFLMPSPVY